MKKNTATRVVFPILDADGDPVTGAAGLDSEYSLDGANFGDCTNEAVEIGVASGIYYLDLVLGETNGDVVAIQVKTTTTGAKTTVLVFYTSAQTLDELDAVVDAVKAKTDLIGASVAPASEYDAELTAIQADLDNPAQYKADVTNLDVAVSTRATPVQVNAEVDTALADIALDHLIQVTAGAVKPTVGSYLDMVMNKDGSQTFNRATDSLEFLGETVAAIFTYINVLDTSIDGIVADLGVIPTANYATLAAYVEDIRTRLIAIVGDTNELQTDWVNGGRLDLILDATALEATLAVVDGIVDTILLDTDALEKIGTNRWRIFGNQLIIYDDDNVTPIYTFNLVDSADVPAMENVYQRTPV